MCLVFSLAVRFAVSAKGVMQTVYLFVDTLDIAFAQTDAPVTTYLISEESDVAVAVVISIIPEEGTVGFDVPELSAGAARYVFERMVMESVRL